ncbi:hypothetical protein EDC30_11851 [Paucimonas lemoignei]|uniref:Uncharacterized protein n=1 Tax=Paucimonas lemoignei TaxID=29443 RepID=A0A4R3HQG0_PAULE|nr:hypothetical protein EDC30_11851 [Paucimonas lemoignei]
MATVQAFKERYSGTKLANFCKIGCATSLPFPVNPHKAKQDRTVPLIKDRNTHRLFIKFSRRNFEALRLNLNWLDTYATIGNGDAIDRTIYLYRLEPEHTIFKTRAVL